MDQIKVPAGTVVQINGMSFQLASETVVLGRAENYQLVLSQAETSGAMPDQAFSQPVKSTTSSLNEPST